MSDVDLTTLNQIAFVLNGAKTAVAVDDDTSLLDALRDQLDIISPKDGCQPQGSCGCCTVLIDGKPRLACMTRAVSVAGKRVTTCEGLSQAERKLIAECFLRAGGVQCGYCTPGIVMRAEAMLDRNPDPTRDEIARELRGHLCRCTGYTKIIDAVQILARARRGEALPKTPPAAGVGADLPRYGGADLVLGDRRFINDIKWPGMLFGALRFVDHPRARIRRIDTAPAEKLDGVLRVVTAVDVPGDRFVGLIEQDWPIFLAQGEETRYVGDVLAAVIATSKRIARRAAARIKVEYDVLPPITNPHDALQPNAPKIHPGGNVLARSALARGDVTGAFAESAHVVEETFRTQCVEHMFLEPEACLAAPIEGEMHVLSQGQGVFDDRRQIAKVLGWPESRVRVQLVSAGGAFGGKEDLSVQGHTALMAHLIERPVKVVLTRQESFRLHPKRHPIEMHYRVGCNADGRLTAVRARMIGDTGAYASVGAKVMERAGGHATGPYRVPNLDIESVAVYTNNPPCGAMRGFGVNQAAFAIESCLNMLAEKVGIDGWEIRWRNALEVGDTLSTGQRLSKPFGLKETLLAVRDQYRGARYAGIACGIKNVGIGNGMPDPGRVVLHVHKDGTVTIRTGFSEMGQGHYTVCVQFACQATGLPPEVFRVVTDTSEEVNCGQTTASRATVLAGNAILDAARKLKADLDAGKPLRKLAGRRYRGEWVCNDTHALGANVPDPKTHLTYGFATQVVILNDDGTLKKVVAAHDVGRVINPTQLAGQIEGSVHMGLGYALTEEFVVRDGQIVTRDVRSLNILRSHHMPEVETIFVEVPDPETAFGSRGVGEIGLVPTAPAVAGALYAYDGVRRTQLPMKDSPAARAILCSPTRGL
jgi:aldehyde oxidoreductase